MFRFSSFHLLVSKNFFIQFIISLTNIVKNGKFSEAKKVLKTSKQAKIVVKCLIVDDRTHKVTKEINSNPFELKGNFIIFNDEKIIM